MTVTALGLPSVLSKGVPTDESAPTGEGTAYSFSIWNRSRLARDTMRGTIASNQPRTWSRYARE